MKSEAAYVKKRKFMAGLQSVPFYIFRIIPINRAKVVFTCIEGTTGYTCNPKYIAEYMIKENVKCYPKAKIVWLVNDINKKFPKEIKVVKNTLWNRAFHLTTSKVWIDNSRKQLECRKRKNQIYIQTWHARLGFKPTGLDRGESFSHIAYLVSKHDSEMVDYWLSNSEWYDKTLPTGALYTGKIFRTSSPRCDILVASKNNSVIKNKIKQKLCKEYNIQGKIDDIHFLMYAPTFRSGSQKQERNISAGNEFPDYFHLKNTLEKKFGGVWIIMMRLHPQLVARNIMINNSGKCIIDISKVDDMYEVLAGCDAFITDYSSAAFDAMIMKIPVFLYCHDYKEYEGERGKLLWNLKDNKFPFPMAETNEELNRNIVSFKNKEYCSRLENFMNKVGMQEDGMGAKTVVEWIDKMR